jgi:ribonuclease D
MVVSLLAATLNQCCAQGRLAVGLVGSSGDLKALVRWHLAGRPESEAPDLARGWRGEVCGRELLDVLAGRRALRIVDPESEIPVRLDPIA